MDLHKIKTEELRGYDSGKLRETEKDIRRALVTIRMDIYTARNQHTGKIRGLRRSLARLLTVQTAAAKANGATKVAAPKAEAKAPKAKSPAKAKAKAAPVKAKAKSKAAGKATTKTATKK